MVTRADFAVSVDEFYRDTLNIIESFNAVKNGLKYRPDEDISKLEELIEVCLQKLREKFAWDPLEVGKV